LFAAGFVGAIFPAEFAQILESAAHRAAEACLVSAEMSQAAAGVKEGLSGEGAPGFLVDAGVLVIDGITLAVDLIIEARGFEGEVPVEAPAGGDVVLDEVAFGLCHGLKLSEIAVEEAREFGIVLIVKNDDPAGEPVADAVLCGASLAFGRDRPVRFLPVSAGGGDLFCGTSHTGCDSTTAGCDFRAGSGGKSLVSGKIFSFDARDRRCGARLRRVFLPLV
jgi:hypothetical protein